jgi:dipeptidase E
MKILLTSQGFATEAIKNKFFEIVGKKPNEISIAFIPTAAYPTPNKSWVKQTRNKILLIGIKSLVDVDLKAYKEKELYEKLRQFDVIFVNGGNTFNLLYWVRKSGFDKVIKRLLNEGKVYVGLSAGSMLACPTIVTASWGDPDDPPDDSSVVNLENWNSLNLVDFYICVHYQDKYKNLIEKQKNKLNGRLICLTDQQAVTKDAVII